MALRHSVGNFLRVALVLLATVTFAQEETERQRISLDLTAEAVEDAMSILAQATGLNILLSDKVTGKVSIFVQDMDPLETLHHVVEVNGFRYIEDDDAFLVLTEEEYFLDRDLGRERRVLRLQHARSTEVAIVLANVVGPHGDVIAYPAGNLLVLVDEEDRVENLVEISEELDTPRQTRVFGLENAVATDMVALLQYHVTGPTVLQADIRTNQVIATDTSARLDVLEELIAELDQADLVETETFVLLHADANHVAEVLREVLTGRSQSQGSGIAAPSGPTNEAPQIITAPRGGPTRVNISSTFERRSFARGGDVSVATPPAPRVDSVVTGTADLSEAEGALGPIATVAADSRTNSVIVTHVAGVIERLRAIVKDIDVPNEFHTYKFLHADPATLDLETRLLQLLPAQEAYLNIDTLSRTVTFRAGHELAGQITKLLQAWDESLQQVRIEAEIMLVNVSLVKELGITWQAILRDSGDFLDRNLDVGIDFPPAIATGTPQGSIRIGNLLSDDYTALIQALAQDGDTQVIASPVIIARDGSPALFSSARDEPYTVITVDGNTQTTLQDVRFLNVGVNISVTPSISRDNAVTMEVVLEISSLVDFRAGNPVVDRSTAQSTVLVQDGGTLILGGLRESSRTKTIQGVPGLRKIPILGGLFRNKRKDKVEREILLILRPAIQPTTRKDIPTFQDIYPQLESDLKRDSLVEKRKD